MSVDAIYQFLITTQETLTGLDGANVPIIVHDAFNENGKLSSTSTPPITKIIEKTIALVAGAYTLDLTTETGTNGVVVNGTGLKVRMIRIKPLAGNIVMAEGASTGYALFPTAKTIYTGGVYQELFGSAAPTIAAGDRQLDFTGTGTDTFEITILMG